MYHLQKRGRGTKFQGADGSVLAARIGFAKLSGQQFSSQKLIDENCLFVPLVPESESWESEDLKRSRGVGFEEVEGRIT